MDNVRRRQGAGTASATDANGDKSNVNAENGKKKKSTPTTPTWVYVLLLAFAVVTAVTWPVPFQPHGEPTMKHVFFYGWMTAISTGCGVLPFMILRDVAKFWVGISNGKAGT